MKRGDTVTLASTNALHHMPGPTAIRGPATIIQSVCPMHQLAFHEWIQEKSGRQFMPWIHEEDLVLVAP